MSITGYNAIIMIAQKACGICTALALQVCAGVIIRRNLKSYENTGFSWYSPIEVKNKKN